MGYEYSDVTRESEPHALPDVEVFYLTQEQIDNDYDADDIRWYQFPGWFWWSCLPGCMPDGDPVGPFTSYEDALADAREVYA